jgi:hypothetical protein
VGAVSGGAGSPEPPPSPPQPLHVVIHERHERLDVALTESVVGGADRVTCHRTMIGPVRGGTCSSAHDVFSYCWAENIESGRREGGTMPSLDQQ